MIDVKKFVVAFLILAALASSSALLVLNFGNSSSGAISPRAPFTAESGSSNPPSITNVFAGAQAPAESPIPEDAAAASSSDPNNLTSRIADSLFTNLMAANPNGPRDDGTGNQVVTVTDPAGALAALSTSSAYQSIGLTDWDFEAALRTMRIATDTSPAAVASYTNALASIIDNSFIKTGLQGMVSSSAAQANLPYISSQVAGALNDIGGLTVPKNLADFHKSFVRVLVYEKNALDLTANASTDPVKALLVFQTQNNKYNAAVEGLRGALQEAVQNKIFSLESPRGPRAQQDGAIAFLANIFGVSTAHAQFVVSDPITEVETSLTFAQIVWNATQNITLQILKNTLITLLSNKVLSYMQNKGNPRFVQSWSGLVSGAFNAAAGSALGQIVPGLCAGFSTDVTGWLKKAYPSANIMPGGVSLNGAIGTNCTLSNTVRNVPGFYNNFDTGGWNGFAALLSPNNNPFGAFAEAYDNVQIVGNTAQAAVQNKAIAGAGFTSVAVCPDGNPPPPAGGPFCGDGSEPFVMTPGRTLSDTMSRNLNSSIDLIVNANDWTGLATTIASALIQQVITAGVNGLAGSKPAMLNPGILTVSPVTCSPSPVTASAGATLSFSASGGTGNGFTWTASGGTPAIGSGPSFTASFASPGIYTVSVSSVGVSTPGSCAVTIQ